MQEVDLVRLREVCLSGISIRNQKLIGQAKDLTLKVKHTLLNHTHNSLQIETTSLDASNGIKAVSEIPETTRVIL